MKRALALWLAIAGLALPAAGQTLFDGALGTLPEAQGWIYTSFPGLATQTIVGETTRFDTWSATTEQAGYARSAPEPLDRTKGFTLLFTVRVEQEAHNNTNRAGFSVIVLSHDQKGIELAFWTNRVFAQSDNPLFTHAEDAAFNPATNPVEYALTMVGDRYQLRADGQPLLDGPVRDYTPFAGVIDPYETPDFLFLGDDTTSARGTVWLRRIVFVPPPVLAVAADGVVSWAGVANVAYRVETSLDLVHWIGQGTVTSATGACSFTNPPGATVVFTRVAAP